MSTIEDQRCELRESLEEYLKLTEAFRDSCQGSDDLDAQAYCQFIKDRQILLHRIARLTDTDSGLIDAGEECRQMAEEIVEMDSHITGNVSMQVKDMRRQAAGIAKARRALKGYRVSTGEGSDYVDCKK